MRHGSGSQIEHFNITVTNLEEAIKFIAIVAPDFKVKFQGEYPSGKKWLHIGNEESYIALQEPGNENFESLRATYSNIGVNHLGFVVEDLDSIEIKLDEASYKKAELPPK